MAATSIEWCDHSINPIRARHKSTGAVGHYCEMTSPGCTNCYSSRMQLRFRMPAFGSGQHRDDVEIYLDDSKLEEVRRRKKPTRYFWCDMTDIFGDWMKPEWLSDIFETIDDTPQHTHMLLTKRPENIRRMWPIEATGTSEPIFTGAPGELGKPLPTYVRRHRTNVWPGTSVEDQPRANKRLPELLKCRDLSPVLFVSAEPLLGPINLSDACAEWWESANQPLWVIAGGESGPHARPMNPAWARSLQEQCQAAGVPFFFKQWGEHIPPCQVGDGMNGELLKRHPIQVPSQHDPSEKNTHYKVGKKAAGRLLDGREWNEFPESTLSDKPT